MKHILFLLISFSICTRLPAQPANAATPEFKIFVKQEGWHIVNGVKCMKLTAKVKNTSGHRISYFSTGYDAHLFLFDTSAVYFCGLSSHHKSQYEFASLYIDGSRQFPLNIVITETSLKTVRFRLGFRWIMPDGQSADDIVKSTWNNPPQHKVFWSDTLTIAR